MNAHSYTFSEFTEVYRDRLPKHIIEQFGQVDSAGQTATIFHETNGDRIELVYTADPETVFLTRWYFDTSLGILIFEYHPELPASEYRISAAASSNRQSIHYYNTELIYTQDHAVLIYNNWYPKTKNEKQSYSGETHSMDHPAVIAANQSLWFNAGELTTERSVNMIKSFGKETFAELSVEEKKQVMAR